MDDNATRSARQPVPPEDERWRELFEGDSARAILARLAEGDPLDLHERCAQRIATQALLFDVQRLHLRSVAHVARHAIAYRGVPGLDVWIAERIRKALGELLDEDTASSAARELPTAVRDERLIALTEVLGLEPEDLARGLASFNRAPHEVRSAFCSIVVEQQSPYSWAEQNGVGIARVKSALRRALWVLGVREELDIDALLAEDDGEDDHVA